MNDRRRSNAFALLTRPALLAAACIAGTVVVALGTTGSAVNTRTITLDSAADLAAGVLDRVSVTSDGQVVIGPELQRIVPDPAAQSIWSLLDLGDGSALAGSGIDGRVYRVENGRSTLYAETGGVVVTSLARGEDGSVYAATIPDAKIFRLHAPQNGHLQAPDELVQLPSTRHVWSIVWDRTRHALLAATGPDGKLFAITRDGRATVLFDSEEPHLLALAIGGDGTVYTGAGGAHAILYAIDAHGTPASLARFTGDEVKSIAVGPDALYVATNEFPDAPEPLRRLSNTASRVPSPGGPGGSRPRPGRGSVYRVTTRGVTERIYNNGDAHVTAVEFDPEHGNQVYAALGVGGRVVAIDPDRTSRVVIDADETQVLALALTARSHLIATGDTGVVYRVSSDRPTGATWTSKVLDGATIARWGAVRWRGTGALDWEARSGNADPPDNTWSAWSALDREGTIQSPAARYLQVRARWTRDTTSVMRSVNVFYLPTNQRAVLTEATAEAKTGDPRPQAVKIGWKVENPDGDSLRYRLRFRSDIDASWRPVMRQGEFVTASPYDWPVEGLPEGFYRVQVEASDEASNPENETMRDVRVTEPVLVDNTPPQVTATMDGTTVHGSAVDGASSITRIEVSVDTQDWRPVRADDGVLDERTEGYHAALAMPREPGEHVVAVRAYDEAGNVGSAAARFRVEPVANNTARATGAPARTTAPRR